MHASKLNYRITDYNKIHPLLILLDGEMMEEEESKLLGEILRKAGISLAVYGIEVEQLAGGTYDCSYEEMQYVLTDNRTTRTLAENLKQELKTSESHLL